MSFRLKDVMLLSLVVFSIGDIVTTLIAYYKFPFFNESSPVYLMTNSIWPLILVKILVTSYLVWWCYKKYDIKIATTIRYIIIYIIVLLTFLNMGIVYNNYKVLQIPPELVKPLPDDTRTEYYNDQVGNLQALNPPINQKQIPLIVPLFFMNLAQFMVWRSFEKELEWKNLVSD